MSGSRLQGLSGWRCGDRVNHLQLCKLVAERNPPPKPTHPHTYTTILLTAPDNDLSLYCYYVKLLLLLLHFANLCDVVDLSTGLDHGMVCSVSFPDIRWLHIFIAVSLTKCVVICCQVIW